MEKFSKNGHFLALYAVGYMIRIVIIKGLSSEQTKQNKK
jgi:hypothetical protein